VNTDLEQQLIFLGIVTAFFILGIPAYFTIRSKRQRQTKTSIPGDDSGILGFLRNDYPAAFDVLVRFVKAGELDRLEKLDPSVDSALADIRAYAQKKLIPERNSSSVLHLSKAQSSSAGDQLKAALVTVFRAAYSDPKVTDLLGIDGLKALDTFLDSLTE
jgi:hypothetical protein